MLTFTHGNSQGKKGIEETCDCSDKKTGPEGSDDGFTKGGCCIAFLCPFFLPELLHPVSKDGSVNKKGNE